MPRPTRMTVNHHSRERIGAEPPMIEGNCPRFPLRAQGHNCSIPYSHGELLRTEDRFLLADALDPLAEFVLRSSSDSEDDQPHSAVNPDAAVPIVFVEGVRPSASWSLATLENFLWLSIKVPRTKPVQPFVSSIMAFPIVHISLPRSVPSKSPVA